MPGERHTLLVTPKVGCGKYRVSLEHVQVCCLQPPRAASESCACLLEGKGIGGGGKKTSKGKERSLGAGNQTHREKRESGRSLERVRISLWQQTVRREQRGRGTGLVPLGATLVLGWGEPRPQPRHRGALQAPQSIVGTSSSAPHVLGGAGRLSWLAEGTRGSPPPCPGRPRSPSAPSS